MRRLMAIVAVDVVGYSRLMAEDEAGTLSALRELRSLIDPIFESGGGRIVKSTGDGVLVEASSVVQATEAALEVQRAVDDWNVGRPEGKAMRLRIGVNLGDVVLDDTGDIYGDGVNVAARLEGLASPGGICLSDAAYQQVKGRIDATLRDMGEQRVKNIPTPIRVWAVGSDGDAAGRPRRRFLVPIAVISAAIISVVAVLSFSGGDGRSATATTTVPGNTATSPSRDGFIWAEEFDVDIKDLVGAGETTIVSLADGSLQGVARNGERWPMPFVTSEQVSALIASQDSAYLGVEGSRIIRAIDPSTGDERWRKLLDLESTSAVAVLARSGTTVYAALGFGIARLDDAREGDDDWTVAVAASQAITTISASETLVVVTDGRFVYGLEPADGSERWRVGPPRIGVPVWVDVSVVEVDTGFGREFEERVVVVTEDLDLVVFDGRTSSTKWPKSAPVSGLPLVTESLVIVSGVDGELIALSVDDGTEVWRRDDIRTVRTPLVHGDRVLVMSGGELLALNPRSGTTIGSTVLPANPTGDLVVVGDLVVFPAAATLFAVESPG
ncbi:MAG TPA: PQQ-binding-like beta-propeller repeat protein [Acidimicrobiia bacterium]|nr:PQQ-binding-like beta-propeller repeat protein [Acidimicrobiia bacterium]